jgi:uncharacterized glyoxalase superfamily protein PhnB
MKLGYTILYVTDVTATVEFYERAFGLQRTFIHESNQFAEMQTGATALAFVGEALMESQGIPFRKNRTEDLPAGFEIAFVTDDVTQAHAVAVKAGAQSVCEPEQKPWGQTVAYVRDLNGVLVEICTPIA